MTVISIISACNNNCKYCFQRESYHKANLMLSYDDVLDIFDWAKNKERIAIMGGEPTLHPDIVKILIAANEQFKNTILFTNLLCDVKLLDKIVTYVPKTRFLINPTTRGELEKLFEENIKHLNSILKTRVSLSLTFSGDEKYDYQNINKTIKIATKYPKLFESYRISPPNPFDKRKLSLNSFEKPILRFCKKARIETPYLDINFDCPINFCQISFDFAQTLIDKYGVGNVRTSDNCDSVVNIMADKSVKRCYFLPDKFIHAKHYRDYESDVALFMDFDRYTKEYLKENGYECRKVKKCNNDLCAGPCIAMIVHIKNILAQKNI